MQVYVVTHKPSGTMYVGATQRPLSKRRSSHYSSALKGSNAPFHVALREHDRADFTWATLSWCATPAEMLQLEIRTIAEYRERGATLYNVSAGGPGSVGWPADLHKKVADGQRGRPGYMRGVPRSEETKARIRAARKGQPARKGFKLQPERVAQLTAARLAKGVSAETRRKMSESQRRRFAQQKSQA